MAMRGGSMDTGMDHARVMTFALPALSTQLANTVSLGCRSLYDEDKETSTFSISNNHPSTKF